MKVISLLEPWASLIACGAKQIETRSWKTDYRGPLLIHASKGMPYKNHDLRYQEPFLTALAGVELTPGKIIASCVLIDCIKMTPENIALIGAPERDFGFYEPGRYMWFLTGAKWLKEPILAKGQLRLWEFDLGGGGITGGKKGNQ